MKPVCISIGIPLIAAAAVLALSHLLYRLAFVVRRAKTLDPRRVPRSEQYAPLRERMLSMIDSAAAIPFQPVETQSTDGLTLRGRYYETAPGAPMQILFHGYRSTGVRDFCGGLPQALQDGYNVLLVDQRLAVVRGGGDLNRIRFAVFILKRDLAQRKSRRDRRNAHVARALERRGFALVAGKRGVRAAVVARLGRLHYGFAVFIQRRIAQPAEDFALIVVRVIGRGPFQAVV